MTDTALFLHWAALPSAFFLDLCLGDPPHRPHPVRLMGRAITWAEPRFRRAFVSPFFAGLAFASALISATFAVAYGVTRLCWLLHPALGFLVETVLLFYCLSARSLAAAALEIHVLLRRGRVDFARAAVGLIVGRDVDRYDAPDIARATVETVAENTVDGVLAPLFFAALGGAPLALAYKMINTLDSMVGYKNERYLLFGRAAARIDDAANWLPARLAVPVISIAALFLSDLSAPRALRTALAEGRNHTSPNAGLSEAAFAGALGVKLNGPNSYGGVLVDKPWIGANFGAATTEDIHRACRLMLGAATLGAFLAVWLRPAALVVKRFLA